ncbi:MAG TPA: division/cell wall cluster transcriptional repressor MraZ [Acidobacteriaceae bacterium]|jgi:MraZ protein|nr:division/cell wall cluster transcriptional repressor MraZ [Acidobacteriaceae bacterium]
MFRGSHITRVDEKGRLKLPAEIKRQIDEEYGGQFYITSRDGKTAEIHPMKEWEKFETKLAAIPSFNPAKKRLLKRLNYYGAMAEMDAQGRVLLPQVLREKAKLLAEVVVAGSEWHLEVSNKEEYDRELEEIPMTQDDEVELSRNGL